MALKASLTSPMVACFSLIGVIMRSRSVSPEVGSSGARWWDRAYANSLSFPTQRSIVNENSPRKQDHRVSLDFTSFIFVERGLLPFPWHWRKFAG